MTLSLGFLSSQTTPLLIKDIVFITPYLPHGHLTKRVNDLRTSNLRRTDSFWRGDILIVRYEGELNIGHKYLDVADTALNAVEDLLRRAFTSRDLEGINKDEKAFKLNIERFSSFQPYTNNG